MTNEFDQELIDTAPDFLSTFGETVTYYPKAGGSRQITAVVTRERPAGLEGAPHGHAPRLTVSIANDGTTGISSSEIDTGGDEVNIAVRIGETAKRKRITKIISQDAGMMELELR